MEFWSWFKRKNKLRKSWLMGLHSYWVLYVLCLWLFSPKSKRYGKGIVDRKLGELAQVLEWPPLICNILTQMSTCPNSYHPSDSDMLNVLLSTLPSHAWTRPESSISRSLGFGSLARNGLRLINLRRQSNSFRDEHTLLKKGKKEFYVILHLHGLSRV